MQDKTLDDSDLKLLDPGKSYKLTWPMVVDIQYNTTSLESSQQWEDNSLLYKPWSHSVSMIP